LGRAPPVAREHTGAARDPRLARMVGADGADLDDGALLALARWFAEAQLRAIVDAAMLVISAAALASDAPVVAAGIGTAIVAEAARRLHRPSLSFDRLIDA